MNKFDKKKKLTDNNIDLSKFRKELLYEKNKNDLNISRHFIERLVERKLYRDLTYIKGMIIWFMDNIFYQSSYTDRTYLLESRGLSLVLKISVGVVSNHRQVIVATVFENEEIKYDYHESITLNPVQR